MSAFSAFNMPSSSQPTSPNHQDLTTGDFDLPSGEDVPLPSAEDLLRITTKIDQEFKETEETPVNNRPMFTERRNSSQDVALDVLSTNEEVNEHTDQIAKLSTTVRLLDDKVNRISELDLIIRQLSSTVKELAVDVSTLKSTLVASRKDITQYQTLTAHKIADVERKAALRQLKEDAKPDLEALVPPTEVSLERSKPAPSSAVEVKTPAKPTFVDLSDF